MKRTRSATPRWQGALVRQLVLFFRQRHAGDVGATGFREIEAKAAPARADVENLHAGLDVELGGEMALLGQLRVFQRAVIGLEIGAGILPVAVEEEVVELARQIVMVGDVVLGLADRIVLVDALDQLAHANRRPWPPWAWNRFRHCA